MQTGGGRHVVHAAAAASSTGIMCELWPSNGGRNMKQELAAIEEQMCMRLAILASLLDSAERAHLDQQVE